MLQTEERTQEQCARSSGTMVKVGQLALQVIQNRGGLAVIPDFLGADTLTTVIPSYKVGSWKCNHLLSQAGKPGLCKCLGWNMETVNRMLEIHAQSVLPISLLFSPWCRRGLWLEQGIASVVSTNSPVRRWD